jgi:hypothetical protein
MYVLLSATLVVLLSKKEEADIVPFLAIQFVALLVQAYFAHTEIV